MSTSTIQYRLARVWCCWLALLMAIPAVSLVGCGGGGTETAEEDDDEEVERIRKTRTKRSRSKGSQSVASNDPKTGLDGIPFDVWPEVYDIPKGEPVTPTTPPMTPNGGGAVTPPPVTPPVTPTTPTTPTTPPPVASGGSVNWSDLISGEELDGEAKALNNILKTGTSTVGQFRRTKKEVGAAGATLAVVAIIAQKHPDDIRWKDKAKFIRGYGKSIWESADKDVSRDTWLETQGHIEDFGTIMSGSTPAGDPPEDESLAASTDFAGIMQRMDQLYKAIKNDGSSSDDFLANKDVLKQRTAMLTVLFQAILDKEFDLAEEADYVADTQAVVQAGKKMRESFLTDNFEGFSDAFGLINGKCNSCHQNYRE